MINGLRSSSEDGIQIINKIQVEQRKLIAEELILLNCGVGEDS